MGIDQPSDGIDITETRPRASPNLLNNLLRFDWSSQARYLHNCPLASFCLQSTWIRTKAVVLLEASPQFRDRSFAFYFMQNPLPRLTLSEMPISARMCLANTEIMMKIFRNCTSMCSYS